MTDLLADDATGPAKTVFAIHDDALSHLPEAAARWARTVRFRAAAGAVLVVPGEGGEAAAAVLGLGRRGAPQPTLSLLAGALADALPEGSWRFADDHPLDGGLAALAFLLGGYRFKRYRSKARERAGRARLVAPAGVDGGEARLLAASVALVRDLVNTPANDLGPEAIEAAIRDLGAEFGASVEATTGEALLERNFPMIHAVGRASATAPRLVDLRWGAADAPKVTLVGKGVAFDTGGLDIKPASGMLLMKKDMGGAANVLGLARMVMGAGLPVRLRVLVPAVENAIAGNSFRPGDVLTSRSGRTVEIGNTDAEGRLVLADALSLADEEAPEILIDMATLTGAARVALGPDLPPFFTDDEDFARDLTAASARVADPLWRLPLWAPYEKNLTSKIADTNNVTSDGHAGSVTAALFLKGFVHRAKIWTHLDVFAWRPKAGPLGPVGGEAQAIRALFDLLRHRHPKG